MNSCLAVVSDMIFASRISATAEKLGTPCRVLPDLSSLEASLTEDLPEIVLVDMNLGGPAAEAAIRAVKSRCPSAQVVAFYSHVQTKMLETARAAGADEVLPRSAFVRRLPDLLATRNDPTRRT